MREQTTSMKVKVRRLDNYYTSTEKETIQTITITDHGFKMNGKRMWLNAFPAEWDIIWTSNRKAKYEVIKILND